MVIESPQIWFRVNFIVVGNMSFEGSGASALDDLPCRYGASRLLMRGPARTLDAPYVAVLGGTETYGKFVTNPFPALLDHSLGKDCVNLGCANAGIDSFLNDPDILGIGARADLAVVQVMGAQNLNNRYYRVHPRRNDRFLEPTALLTEIYGEIDFTEFNFNKHLVCTLNRVCPSRFAVVRDELRRAWLGRMSLLLRALGPKVVLLWLRYEPHASGQSGADLGDEPMLIDRDMLDQLADETHAIVEVQVQRAGPSGDMDGMMFGAMQAPAAEHMIGPDSHRRIAEALGRGLAGLS